jgi:hypothetical protein
MALEQSLPSVSVRDPDPSGKGDDARRAFPHAALLQSQI